MKMRPAALAQLVEHLTRNEKVVSSILTGGSTKIQVSVGAEKSGAFLYALFDISAFLGLAPMPVS